MRRQISFLLPGLGLILMAFAAGSQKDATLGLIGFLPFFTMGALLIFHGFRKPPPGGGQQGGKFLWLFLLLACAPCLYAEHYGDSGGIKNEGEVPVRIKLTLESGDYFWNRLTAGQSLDFPENIKAVKVTPDVQVFRAFVRDPRIKIAVYQPDGSREEITALGKEVVIQPNWRRRDTAQEETGLRNWGGEADNKM